MTPMTSDEDGGNALTSRRRFLQLAAGAAVVPPALTQGAEGAAAADTGATLADGAIRLFFDAQGGLHVAALHAGHAIDIASGQPAGGLETAHARIETFVLRRRELAGVEDAHGKGRRLTIVSVAPEGVEKTTQATLYERYPGFVFLRVSYLNVSAHALPLKAWTEAALRVPAGDGARPAFWSYSGATYSDRRDWVQPLHEGFAQENFMGMSASDYGSGTPIVDVWRRDAGLAIGHLETTPRQVALPLKCAGGTASMAMRGVHEGDLAPGERLDTPEAFIAVHAGDYFATLESYRRVMGDRGLHSPTPPPESYEGIWCAWGYEREFTASMIEGTLAKARDLGLRWAVLDDGWQNNVGDWHVNLAKYPGGEADIKRLVAHIRGNELRPRLWYTPLAVAPGSDTLHDHTDMLLLDRDGAPQNISWWNSFYLCPAYAPTVAATQALVRKFLGDWGFAGLKIDGQHLNGVAPCYNPAHRHARPEESVEGLHDFFRVIYETAMQINPEAVVELCPCGTSYAFYNFPYINQAPASDPESSWQVRLKGKTLKALMGPSAPFAGDHVELSDGGDDFASTVGIGAIVSTKFTWPVDPKPKDSFLLTPEREALWRRWIGLYNEKMLPTGIYRGTLYDIGHDKPETHVVEKSGRLYYAFYARRWSGPVQLRGLAEGSYAVRDYFGGRDLGLVTRRNDVLHLAFERFLVLEAVPA
jgi:alpha-galactosidase